MIRTLFTLAAAVAAMATYGSHAAAQTTASAAKPPAPPSTIPIEDFYKKPLFRSPKLSPSGQQLAMLVPAGNKRVGLAVANIATPTKFVGIAQFDDADVLQFDWVNEKRLVFSAVDFQSPLADQAGSGLYAVDADGSNFLWLIERDKGYRVVGVAASRPLPARNRYVEPVRDGSDDVLIQTYVGDSWAHSPDSSIRRLNTRALTVKSVYSQAVPSGVASWVLDQNLQPRFAISSDTYGDRNDIIIWHRATDSSDWKQLDKFDLFNAPANSAVPVSVDFDGTVYATSAQNIQTTNPNGYAALYRYDVEKKRLGDKPLLAVKDHDFMGTVIKDRGAKRTIGVRYISDAYGVAWFDEGMQKVQGAVDKLLPSTNNSLGCPAGSCMGASSYVVTAYSDRQPPAHFLYNTATNSLKLIGAAYPWLDSRQLAEQDVTRIKARDGKVDIPLYITKPQGKGPWPTVMLVHGGPFVRGHEWGFSPDAQFLASRGYLVIEPEFRGSLGYGDKHFRAGWKQWGLSMQDDVTDATQWAIDQKMADPNRIAIAGASYGGYATMMGLLKEPKLYKAGINWVGVTDINLMYDIGWSDFAGSQWTRFGMRKMVGDPKTDAEQLTATSPLKNAARIKQPVLMAYGEEDLRVPLPHGTRMRDALTASGNTNVEWVQYAGEGHGFMLTENNVNFWSRVEKFLAKHLAK